MLRDRSKEMSWNDNKLQFALDVVRAMVYVRARRSAVRVVTATSHTTRSVNSFTASSSRSSTEVGFSCVD